MNEYFSIDELEPKEKAEFWKGYEEWCDEQEHLHQVEQQFLGNP